MTSAEISELVAAALRRSAQALRLVAKDLVWRPFQRFLTDGGNQYAGNIAFLMFLALFPFLIFMTSLAAFLEESAAASRFVDIFLDNLPPVARDFLGPVFEEVVNKRSGSLLTLSIIGALWISTSAVEAMRSGLNKAYRVAQPRSFLYHRIQGICLVVLAAGSIVVISTVLILLPAVDDLVTLNEDALRQVERLKALGRFVAVPFIMVSLGVVVYRYLPNSDYGWRRVLPGSLLSFGLWWALVEAFSLYVRNFDSFSLIYGGLGGVIALLLFLYFSAAAFLIGAELNVVLADLVSRRVQRADSRSP